MQLSALQEFARSTWAKVLGVLAVITMLLGVATEAVVLYGQGREAAIKSEIAINAGKRQTAEAQIAVQKARIERQAAINADVLEKAKAAKTSADALAAKAVADNARIRQEAEAKYADQKAVVEQAIARYAERMKRAEADKLQAEADAAQEVAKNSEVKLRAEAEKANLELLKVEADAAVLQWLNNCQAVRGSLAGCSTLWSPVARSLFGR